MNNKLTQLMGDALSNSSNRSHAQVQLLQLRDSNPEEFIIQFMNIFGDNNYNQNIRQSAGILILTSLKLKINSQKSNHYWDLLSPKTKELVKNIGLQNLIASQNVIIKTAATIIAVIASIEVPRGQWLSIVDILANNSTHNDQKIRKASILTIGQTCQMLFDSNREIDPKSCEQFLGAIIMGSRQTHDITIVEQSIKALRNSLNFMKQILQNNDYRNEVFKLLLEKLTNENDDRTLYQALFQFCKVCYEYLHGYLEFIVQIVLNHLNQRNNNTILALELLDTIGTEYLQKLSDSQNRVSVNHNIPNFITPMESRILPEIMRCFIIENKDELEFSQLRNSAAKTLSTFITAGNRETIDAVTNGTLTCLKSNNSWHRQASAVLISTICQSNDREYVGRIISNAFESLFSLLEDQQNIVVLNTLNGLSVIAEFYAYVFYNHLKIGDIIDKLLLYLGIQGNSPVVNAALNLIKNMTENMDNNCILIIQPGILLIKIVKFAEKYLSNFDGDNKEYLQKVVIIIMNCLIKIKNREVVTQMTQFLIGQYQKYLGQPHLPDVEMRLMSIVALIHTSVMALENTVPKVELVSQLHKLINVHLERFGIEEEGLNLLSVMAISFSQGFQNRDQYWDKILQGLNQIGEPKIFKTALCCVGDFSRVYGQEFKDKELSVLKKLLKLIHENLERDIKLNILACISDLLLGLGQTAQVQLDNIIGMIDLCFQAVYEFSANPNERQYMEELKKGLIDLYACLSFAINARQDRKKGDKLLQHFPYVAAFIVKTCDPSQHPTIEYIKCCLYLIFDTATFYWKVEGNGSGLIRNIIEQENIKSIVKRLGEFRHRDDIRELESMIQQRYSHPNI